MRDQQARVILIEPLAPPKPAFGAPCNGCGVCCLSEPCPLGMWISRRRHGRCDALRWSQAQGLYRCGALTDAASVWPHWPAPVQRALARLARRWIASGAGCDADLDVNPGN